MTANMLELRYHPIKNGLYQDLLILGIFFGVLKPTK